MNRQSVIALAVACFLLAVPAVAVAQGDLDATRSLDAAKVKAAEAAAESIDKTDLAGLKRVAVIGLYKDDGSIAEYLTVKLIGTKLTVLAREDIDKVLAEYGFTMDREDVFDPATIKTLGKILAADSILFGTVQETEFEADKGLATVRLTLKLAEVETGALRWGDAITATARSDDWLAGQKKIEEERASEEARRALDRQKLDAEQQRRLDAARQQKLADGQARRDALMKKWAVTLLIVAVAAIVLALIIRAVKGAGKHVKLMGEPGRPSDEWAAVNDRLKRDSALRAGIVQKLRGSIATLRRAENAAHGAKKDDAAQEIGKAVGEVTALAADIENAPAGDKFAVDKAKVAGGTLDKIIAFDTVFDELVKNINAGAEAAGVAVGSGGDVPGKITQLKSLVAQLRAKYDERDTYIRELC